MNRTGRMRNVAAALAPLLIVVLGGCSPYALKGRVVEGDASYIAIVEADDARLKWGQGVAGASLHLQMDPGRLNRKTLARSASGADGEVNIPVEEFGAGMFEYDVGLFVRRKGYDPAELPFRLPPGGKRILVVLAPGADRELGEDREDFSRTAEEFMR